MIRSFSEGNNWPPEYPIYAGEPIRYHFFFYFLVGMLVKAGVNFGLALNVLSTIGFAGLIISIFILARKITRSYAAAWLSVLFILFNSSLQWIYFITKLEGKPFFETLVKQEQFASFGPWSGDALSAFWHLNIYTNQRHLAFSFLVMFIAIWAVFYSKLKRGWIITAIIIGLLAFMHKAILMVLLVVLGFHFLIRSQKRMDIFLAISFGIILAIPGLTYLNAPNGTPEKTFGWEPGFLYKATEWKEAPALTNSFLKWLLYWFINLGILPLVALWGSILTIAANKSDVHGTPADKLFKWFQKLFKKPQVVDWYDSFFNERTVWFWSATAVFAIANLFTFSIDVAANHKLINFSAMIWGIYAAYLLVRLIKLSLFDKAVSVLLIIIMTVSGIVDIFPIINDDTVVWPDTPTLAVSQWIRENTTTDDTFFNATYEVAPVLLTGRKTMWGWDYLIWSIGYNVEERKLEMQRILTGQSTLAEACSYLESKKVDYIYKDLSPNFLDREVNHQYFEATFQKAYSDTGVVTIFSVQESCRGIPK
jgi:hypothetical protein